MWRSVWRSIDRFSLQHFKYVINELRGIKAVNTNNRELVVDLLQSIVEIVTYGDRQDPMIFECFMEYQVLSEFVRMLKVGSSSRIEAPLLQYLSIMIQNMDNEHAIYYCLSNDYVNNIIMHQYNFEGGDLAPYYISFLRAVSSKINRDILCLLVKVEGDAVVSFPLYCKALKFSQHGEKMIQTAVRALTLNIYNVSDDMVYQFMTSPPVSNYFSDLVHRLREQCFHLDGLIHDTKDMNTTEIRKKLFIETDKIVDDLYYFKDLLSVGESRLSKVVNHNLLNLLVFPILLPLCQLMQMQTDGPHLTAVTTLYIISRLVQVVGGKDIVNSVAKVLLYPFASSSFRDASNDVKEISLLNYLDDIKKSFCFRAEFEGTKNFPADDNVCPERCIMLDLILSDDHSLSLASLFLLLTLAENKDLEDSLASYIGWSIMRHEMVLDISDSESQASCASILAKFMPQIINVLLKVLENKPTTDAHTQWHTGWFLRKLLVSPGKRIDGDNLHLFNASYNQSCKQFEEELDGCWFDCILDTVRKECANCKKALEEPSQSKDPLFLLELGLWRQTSDGDDSSSYDAWHKMVNVVKVFVLNLQLRELIYKGELLEKPLIDSSGIPPADSGRTPSSNFSSASFGSEVSIGSGIPCRIAFSNAGIRDIYLIPNARGTSGRLLLVEKHPFRSQRGVVIAIAPLAGLSPKIDEDHPTWLHLRIREFEPRLNMNKSSDHSVKGTNHDADGRWTLGFSNPKACMSARLAIVQEISKQRSAVRSALAPVLDNHIVMGTLLDGKDG